jgi:ATP-binding cassette subfamily B protein
MGFLFASLKLYAPAKWLAKFPATVQPGLVAAERVFEFLDTPVELTDRPDGERFTGVEEEIHFDGVGFEYEADAPVLRDIDLHVKAGDVIALVGPSGAGKTTLSMLVPRIYDVTSGHVEIDGHDVRGLTMASLADTVGVVTQDAHLFHDSIAANLRYARPHASDDELASACRAARIHHVIERLPDGYDTVVGERGYRMSGGEKQRIAIARVILKDPAVVVLDEATAHLDSESERLVQAALREILEARTSLVIAHRLSTIVDADLILVLDEGEVVERGTHAQLLAAGGLYAELARTQLTTATSRQVS